MHRNRLIALVGVVIGIIGLFMKSLITDGEGEMETLAEIARGNPEGPPFPRGIPTIWGGLDTWAQVLLVVLIIVVVFLSLRPDIAKGFNRTDSMIIAVIGVALLAYAIYKFIDAGDSATNLAGAFALMASGGAPTEAHEVSRGLGFIVLVIGTVLVTFAGAMGFMGSDND